MTETDAGRLYPPMEPNRTGMLAVDALHSLYWEESGNPDGVAVVFLHGGPGSGTVPFLRRFFDPSHFRIVLFDQRGAGRSMPFAEIRDNTTDHLVADMERLRELLGIERWILFGGSWGSTLALAYGQTHPERCLGFVLRGVFLFRKHEVDWFLHGMKAFYPEAAAAFREFLPEEERGDLLQGYKRRLDHPDPAVHMPAALSWCAYESGCARLMPREGANGKGPGNLAMARIEAHYMSHGGFIGEGALLKGLSALSHLPLHIVQGRYDVICPPATAAELAAAWPGSVLTMVADAGHSALEPGIRDGLVEAMESLKKL